MKTLKSIAAVLALTLASTLAGTGCRESSGAQAIHPAPALPQVTVASVIQARPVLTMNLPAELAPFQDAIIAARVSGFVRRLYVDRGSAVRAGQLMAVIEAPDLVARRAAAEQRLGAARAQSVQAQANLARDQATLQRLRGAAREMPGAVAGNDITVARQTVAADQAELQSRQAAERAAGREMISLESLVAYLQVKAPFSGMVVKRMVSAGSLVGPAGLALFDLQQLNPLRLVLDVPEAQAAGFQKGSQVRFQVTTFPGQDFYGVVARVSHSLRPATRTMPIELDVPNPRLQLSPGMYAHVFWPMRRPAPSLLVPAGAIVNSTEATYVEAVRRGRIRRVPVEAGMDDKNLTEVFGALRPGESVVVPGNEELRDGETVLVKP